MGKEKSGFLTPKAIANRIKAKGLQKLRWYCQMCQKQCRDENGFKCHTMSESHQRQLLLFAENPDEYIDTFSKDFMDGYTELLRRRFGTKRVHCNIVYQEYISERDHVHMNSTQWETLTDFVKWLGREGKCNVDNTEKGWFIQYIDRDPETIKKQEQVKAKEKMDMDDNRVCTGLKSKCNVDNTEKGWFIQYIDRDPETIKKQEQVKAKEKMDMDDNERSARLIQQQIERAAKQEKNVTEAEFTELLRENEEEKVTFNLAAASKREDVSKTMAKSIENPFKAPAQKSGEPSSKASSSSSSTKDPRKPQVGEKRKSALDEIMEFEEKKKERINRKEYWLHAGIVVKIVSKKLGEKYYKQKGYIKEVIDLYGGIVKMLDTGDKVKVDQTHLETVIPAIGKSVMLVNGAYRGQAATLESINERKFSCSVSLNSGSYKGRILDNIPYEDICKIYQPS